MQIKFVCLRVLRPVLSVLLVFALAFGAMCFTACISSIRRQVRYRFVYCYTPMVSVPSRELAESVRAMGYAGYILRYDGMYYVVATLSATNGEAQSHAGSFEERGVSAGVFTAERLYFELENYNAESNSRLYGQNIDSLDSIISELYDCAEILQREGASSVREKMISLHNEIASMCAENISNCFTRPLSELAVLSAECAYGIIHIRNIRYLATAVADVVMNISLT